MIKHADIQMEDTLCNIYKAYANHYYKQRSIKQKQSMYIYNTMFKTKWSKLEMYLYKIK